MVSSHRFRLLGAHTGLQIGEQPLKYVRPRQVRGRESSLDPDTEVAQTALYALYQTDLYTPDPVINGRIPKNGYGNIDVYVPSMVPPGAVHVRALDAKHAAKLLNVDYADAVTGFQFKGRHGTAVVEGIIVASEFRDAVEAVLDGMAYAKAEAMEASRSAEALRLWRRFLVGMRVVQRVRGYRNDGEGDEEDRIADEEFRKELDQELAQYRETSPGSDGGGGFMVDSEKGDTPARTARMARRQLPSEDEDDEDLHDDDYDNDGGGFLPEPETGSEGEEEAAKSQCGVPSLICEPSLFGLENFDIPMAMPLSEDEQDEYGGAETEDKPMSPGIRAGPIPGPTSPAAIVDKRSLVIQASIHEEDEISSPHRAQPAPDSSVATIPSSKNLVIDPSDVPKAVSADRKQPSPVPSSTSSGFDNGLLLEDPEDEDAEPEWLL